MNTAPRLFAAYLILTVFAANSSAQDANRVSFHEKSDSELQILIGNDVFSVLNHGKQWNKPFLYPMYAADGTNILRPIIATKADQGSSKTGNDHHHHKGVWIAVDSVNDEKLNFWSEKDKIVNQKVKHSVTDDGFGQLTLVNAWMQDDKPLVKETTTITFHPTRLVTCHIELAAIDKDVTIYDTKEGFFAVRVAHTMRESEGGHITNAEGLNGEKECWGKPSPWIDYFGEVDGKTYGVTLMDHPDNFRKSRYHVRSYGLFAISPFGPRTYSKGEEPEAPVTLSHGKKSMTLTYGMYVHNGDTKSGGVDDAYKDFLKLAK